MPSFKKLHINYNQILSQEPNASKDEELAKKVNESMNSPPKPGSSGGRGGGGATDLSELLGGNGNLQVIFTFHSNICLRC